MDVRVQLWCLLVVLVAGLLAVSSASEDEEGEWGRFRFRNGKKYDNEVEYTKRRGIFATNAKRVKAQNQKYKKKQSGFRMELNKYSDLSEQEFGDMVAGGAPHTDDPQTRGGKMFKVKGRGGKGRGRGGKGKGRGKGRNKGEPETHVTVDWRQTSCVTPVKNQQSCGSCYAFAATGAMESHHCLRTGKSVLLSEQNLVDCSQAYGNKGCDWGWAHNCWTYVKEGGGISSQTAYPYVNMVRQCQAVVDNLGVVVHDFVSIPQSESAMAEAVEDIGPVAVSVYISPDMQFYKSGVLDDPSCTKSSNTHAVLVVGFGTEGRDDYWIVKNSWGSEWGEDGYLKMSRNKRNQCDIASYAKFPVM